MLANLLKPRILVINRLETKDIVVQDSYDTEEY